MNTPKPKAAKGLVFVDPLGEEPVIGTMNYARKFPDGAVGGYAAPGMPVSVGRASYLPPKKKKESMSLATYRKGAKSITTGGGDKERATPSVTPTPDYPVATSPFSEVDDGDADMGAASLAPADSQTQSLRAPLQKAMDLPPARNAGTRTPKDYKEAAAVIRGDKGLYSQYKAGIASGKAFSLSVGGKTFKYAATPKTPEPLQGGDIAKSIADEPAATQPITSKATPKIMSKKKAAAPLPANSEERASALQNTTVPTNSTDITQTVLNSASTAPEAAPVPKRMSAKPKASEQEVVTGNLRKLKADYNALPAADRSGQKGKMLQAEYLKAKKAAGSWADGF